MSPNSAEPRQSKVWVTQPFERQSTYWCLTCLHGFGEEDYSVSKDLCFEAPPSSGAQGFHPQFSRIISGLAWRSSWGIQCSYIWFYNGGSFAISVLTMLSARCLAENIYSWKELPYSSSCNRCYFILNVWFCPPCTFLLCPILQKF